MTPEELANKMACYSSSQIQPGPAIALGECVILVPLSAPGTILHPTLFNAQKPNPDEKGIIQCALPSVEPLFAGLQWYCIPQAASTSTYIPGMAVMYATPQSAVDAQTAANAKVTRDCVNATIAVGTAGASLLGNAFNALTKPRPVQTT